jgi:hypothetical protein
MSCVVVDDQFIGTEHLRETLRWLTIGVNDTGHGQSLAASTLLMRASPSDIQLRVYADRRATPSRKYAPVRLVFRNSTR